jgi:hypothetical protein
MKNILDNKNFSYLDLLIPTHPKLPWVGGRETIKDTFKAGQTALLPF